MAKLICVVSVRYRGTISSQYYLFFLLLNSGTVVVGGRVEFKSEYSADCI